MMDRSTAGTMSLSLSRGSFADIADTPIATVGTQTAASDGYRREFSSLDIARFITSCAVGYIRALVLTAPNQLINPGPLIVLVPTSVEQLSGIETLESEHAPESEETSAITNCFSRIAELSGLTKSEAAQKLLGVSRQAPHHWSHQGGIKSSNLQKLLAIEDILERAKAIQQDRAGVDAVHWWLFQPRGESGITPQELIRKGDFARARLYAMTVAPAKRVESPDRLKGTAELPETLRIERVLESYDESDYQNGADQGHPRG